MVTSPRGCSTKSAQTDSACWMATARSLAVSASTRPGAVRREATAGALGERDAGLPLERLELLRDGRRGEVQGLRDGGHRAAIGELAQEPEAANVHVVRLHPQCSFIRLC